MCRGTRGSHIRIANRKCNISAVGKLGVRFWRLASTTSMANNGTCKKMARHVTRRTANASFIAHCPSGAECPVYDYDKPGNSANKWVDRMDNYRAAYSFRIDERRHAPLYQYARPFSRTPLVVDQLCPPVKKKKHMAGAGQSTTGANFGVHLEQCICMCESTVRTYWLSSYHLRRPICWSHTCC